MTPSLGPTSTIAIIERPDDIQGLTTAEGS
jgi:hypothetical protein